MKKLLFSINKKDFEIQTFRSGGSGGQHQNKTESGIRIIHKDSGAIGESRDERSQHSNKKIALKRLVDSNKFKSWLNRRVFEINQGKTIDQIVDDQMGKDNLKIEIRNNENQWKVINYDDLN